MKHFDIPKQLIWEAYKQVLKNKGAAGIDDITISKFKEDLTGNLYKLWNRMSSGCYFPKPVKAVAIPKSTGGQRILCIPTIFDRIAQTAVAMYLEPLVEPKFHENSYGYRPNKSALEAIEVARKRCWKNDWVIDLDISGFFDNVDHELALQAIKEHTDCKWVILYVERWMKAPIQLANGNLISRNKGVPQGGSISPVISNIFMHLVFDDWINRKYPTIPFERYVDDVIVHCKTQKQADFIKKMIKERLAKYKLELHPEKTHIVFCRDNWRRNEFPNYEFTFLGYTFRPRAAKGKEGKCLSAFLPAISNKANKAITKIIRSWKIHQRTGITLEKIAEKINPIVRGWYLYYGKFYQSKIYSTLRNIDKYLRKWIRAKYRNLRNKVKHSCWLLSKIKKRSPIFYHWTIR